MRKVVEIMKILKNGRNVKSKKFEKEKFFRKEPTDS